MSENTKIEWATHTFNPWEGCQKVGPGCDHCYAETRNARFAGGQALNWGPGAPRRRTSTATWNLPRRWNDQAGAFMAQHGHRQRVFCASLADVFDNAVDPQWRADLFTLIAATPNLDWLLLTKRVGNVEKMVMEALRAMFLHSNEEPPAWPWPNVWLGATIVNQAEADGDIPKLLAVPAAKRFLSMEPLLGPVDLTRIDLDGYCEIYPLAGTPGCEDDDGNPAPDLPALDWVIVGGESGPDARPMNPAWARSLRDQCSAAGVPYLFKQWGEWAPPTSRDELRFLGDMLRAGKAIHVYGEGREEDGHFRKGDDHQLHVGKKAAGRLLDGRTWDEVPA